MISTEEIVEQASSLPIEERAFVVESLLQTLNTPNKDIDNQWTKLAKNRLEELESGKVKSISGELVFKDARAKLSK